MKNDRNMMYSVLLFLSFPSPLSSAGTHSLKYLYTAVTQGIHLPEVTTIALLDEEQFEYYDSNISEAIPRTEWIKDIKAADPDYWKTETKRLQGEQMKILKTLTEMMKNHNYTKVHTLQRKYGCELDADGTVRGYNLYGFDGEDLLTVILSKTKVMGDLAGNEADYLQNYKCIEWLEMIVRYGSETLERKVRPEVSVFQKHSSSPEVVCLATGFFPEAVNITWQKDGEDVHEDVELRETLPNQDGSFQKRSILKVPAEELQKHTYTCVIQHSSLEKELVLPVPKGGGSGGVQSGIIVGVVVFIFLIVAVILIWKNCGERTKAAAPNDLQLNLEQMYFSMDELEMLRSAAESQNKENELIYCE